MKLDITKLIHIIDKSLKICIGYSSGLQKRNEFYYTIKGDSSALNRLKNSEELVTVSKWFNDFWLFFEIKFIFQHIMPGKKKQIQTDTRISLSVFQGEDFDDKKHQLFRAEWDDYNNPDEKHAQPHWHITSSQAIENTIYEYATVFEHQDFLHVLESEKQKILDVKKIHFAMNGDWQNSKTHIHEIADEKQIEGWLLGILNHIRTELNDL